MQRTDILDLLHYHDWANAKMLTAVEQLSLEQLIAPTNLDHGSVFQTLLHMVDVEWSWRLMAQQLPATQFLWEVKDLPDLAAIQQVWQSEQLQRLDYVQQLADQSLNAEVDFGTAQGRPVTSAKLWHILAHIVTHSTQHRTELARYLTDCGHSPGEMGLLEALYPKTKG